MIILIHQSFCCIFSRDIYLSFEISLLKSVFSASLELLCVEAFLVFIIFCYQQFYYQLKNQLLLLYFWIVLFEAVLIACVVNCLALTISFWLYLPLKFLLTHLAKGEKLITFYLYLVFWFNSRTHFHNNYII